MVANNKTQMVLAHNSSILQLQQFGIPSHSVSGNHHLLAPSNVISKLIYLPSPASPFPTQRHQRLRLEHAWICALYKFCNNNNNNTSLLLLYNTDIQKAVIKAHRNKN